MPLPPSARSRLNDPVERHATSWPPMSPRYMIDPFPNSFSILDSAASRSFPPAPRSFFDIGSPSVTRDDHVTEPAQCGEVCAGWSGGECIELRRSAPTGEGQHLSDVSRGVPVQGAALIVGIARRVLRWIA